VIRISLSLSLSLIKKGDSSDKAKGSKGSTSGTPTRQKRTREVFSPTSGNDTKKTCTASSSESIAGGMAQGESDKIIKRMTELFDTKLEPFIKQCNRASEAALRAIDKLEREKNLVFFGVKEKDKEGMEEQLESVMENCKEIGVKDVIIDDIYRIGKKPTGDKKGRDHY